MDKATLDEMRVDCVCEKQEYCPLEELVLHAIQMHFTAAAERMFMQHKCVEKFKDIASKEVGKDIGWKNAYMKWAEDGMAVKFAKVFKAGMKFKEIWGLLEKQAKEE